MATSRKTEKWNNVKSMFSLIIGIDEYKHMKGLKGAGADADAMEKFLKTDMKIPPQRIVNLRNRQATRNAICQAFSGLWDNTSIASGDPILIYFAGHGCEMPRPHGWETGGEENIQGICPYDVEVEDSPSRQNFPIPDRTLGAFLNILSQEKGHCITIIFDCCHSASGVRAPGQELERAAEFQGHLPSGIDMNYLRNFNKAVPLLNPQSRSYVFIAACGAKEKAREKNGRGKFTKALLNALSGNDVDKLSFVDFMDRLKNIDDQNPQCEGQFKNRILFSNRLRVGWGLFPFSRVENAPETYRIEAGLLHGVDNGSLFDIYRTAAIVTPGVRPTCSTLLAKEVHPLHTIAMVKNGELTSETGYAHHISSGSALKVFFTPAFRKAINPKILRCPYDDDFHCKLAVVEDEAQADFIVDIQKMNIVFSTKLKGVVDYGFRQLPNIILADKEHVSRVLHAAFQWKRHSDIATESLWIKNIDFEFWSLEKFTNGDGVTSIKPKCLVPSIGRNAVSLTAKPKNRDLYGMIIRNKTGLNLHVSIVSFDIDELTIEPRFSGPIGVNVQGNADPSLPKGNHLTIGYGNSGVEAFWFDSPVGGLNVTVLKFYFTTMPMDLGWLKQTSPFSGDRGIVSREKTQELMTALDPQCATALFTVVQKA